MIIASATTKRAQPENLKPAYLFNSHAVNGHVDKPENNANQPFVGGQGPSVIINPRPPMPATIVHTHAAIVPSMRIT